MLIGTVKVIPSLNNLVSTRASDSATVNDRKNMITAGLNMVQAKPLFGFGWQMQQPILRPTSDVIRTIP